MKCWIETRTLSKKGRKVEKVGRTTSACVDQCCEQILRVDSECLKFVRSARRFEITATRNWIFRQGTTRRETDPGAGTNSCVCARRSTDASQDASRLKRRRRRRRERKKAKEEEEDKNGQDKLFFESRPAQQLSRYSLCRRTARETWRRQCRSCCVMNTLFNSSNFVIIIWLST